MKKVGLLLITTFFGCSIEYHETNRPCVISRVEKENNTFIIPATKYIITTQCGFSFSQMKEMKIGDTVWIKEKIKI